MLKSKKTPWLLKETPAEKDLFKRDAALATLNAAIRGLPPPGCIALYGSWGTGKTTLMRLAEHHWDGTLDDAEEPLCRTIWFDPWEHERQGEILSPLMNTIVSKAYQWRPDEKTRQRLLALGIRLGKTLLSLGAKGALGYLATKVGIKELKNLKVDDVAAALNNQKRFPDRVADAKRDFAEVVDLALAGTGANGRLVIFLDDLDRCLPDSMVTLIEATKLLMCGQDGTRVIFVFGLDRTIVGEAIAKRYPRSSAYTGESYLEKIFDVSLEVPTLGDAEIDGLLQPHLLANHELRNQIEEVFGQKLLKAVLLRPEFANPRVTKRALNRLILLFHADDTTEATRKLFSGSTEDTQKAKRRFLLWIAGAERFRGFRYAFMEASEQEIEALHQACQGKPVQDRLGHGLRRTVGSPGFLDFYEQLIGTKRSTQEVDAERSPSPVPAKPSLMDFDIHLRKYGL